MKDSQTQWTGNTFQAKAMMGIIIKKKSNSNATELCANS
jgi:hypothetical protein